MAKPGVCILIGFGRSELLPSVPVFIWKGDEKLQFMDFRSKLGWDLINNEYLDIEEDESERRSKRKKRGDHELEKAPPHAKN